MKYLLHIIFIFLIGSASAQNIEKYKMIHTFLSKDWNIIETEKEFCAVKINNEYYYLLDKPMPCYSYHNVISTINVSPFYRVKGSKFAQWAANQDSVNMYLAILQFCANQYLLLENQSNKVYQYSNNNWQEFNPSCINTGLKFEKGDIILSYEYTQYNGYTNDRKFSTVTINVSSEVSITNYHKLCIEKINQYREKFNSISTSNKDVKSSVEIVEDIKPNINEENINEKNKLLSDIQKNGLGKYKIQEYQTQSAETFEFVSANDTLYVIYTKRGLAPLKSTLNIKNISTNTISFSFLGNFRGYLIYDSILKTWKWNPFILEKVN